MLPSRVLLLPPSHRSRLPRINMDQRKLLNMNCNKASLVNNCHTTPDFQMCQPVSTDWRHKTRWPSVMDDGKELIGTNAPIHSRRWVVRPGWSTWLVGRTAGAFLKAKHQIQMDAFWMEITSTGLACFSGMEHLFPQPQEQQPGGHCDRPGRLKWDTKSSKFMETCFQKLFVYF